jgi:5,10-methylenetetrahydrofolate reductase
MSRLEELALDEDIIRGLMPGANFQLARLLAERLRDISAEREAIQLLEQAAAAPAIVEVEVQSCDIVTVTSRPQRRFPVKFVVTFIVLLAILIAVIIL